ncbi:Mur ligase family protein [Methanobrevibacter curvatus]|nr:Mur ligase family protein [Methanobrevibacter curvatus]
MDSSIKFTINSLSKIIGGTIKGTDSLDDMKLIKEFNGVFNILSDAKKGDIIIRHWIDEKGIQLAYQKGVLAIITEDIRGTALDVAESFHFPVIVVDKIEIANAFALKYTLGQFGADSKKIVVSGTNGKSTTSHLIYHILKSSGFNAFTNTDSKSEYNTLIDPMASKLISDNYDVTNPYEYIVIEVSEVQGWLNKLMKNHAYLMSEAVDPDVAVVTNISLDHIGLVNSIDEVFNETSGLARGINNGFLVLNLDDENVKSMAKFADDKNKNVKTFYFSFFDNELIKNTNIDSNNNSNSSNNTEKYNEKEYYKSIIDLNALLFYSSEKKGIIYKNELVLELDDFPLKSKHFIQNILAAFSVCVCLKIPIESINKGIKSYKPLKRRFSTIHLNPLIIDDFAHNPEGIKATINAVSKLDYNALWIINAIRGSRGLDINSLNANSLVEAILNLYKNEKSNLNLLLTNSVDVVDAVNLVTDDEKNIFLDVLKQNNINFNFYDKLEESLLKVYDESNLNDVILLIGAQGMDPAESVLKKIIDKN